jgi:hypothetical protein
VYAYTFLLPDGPARDTNPIAIQGFAETRCAGIEVASDVRNLILASSRVLVCARRSARAAGAIYYSDIPGACLRGLIAATFVLATALSFIVLPRRRRTLAEFVVVFALIVAWWLRIPPPMSGTGSPRWRRRPWATIEGDRVTIHGTRNFEYRTDTDFARAGRLGLTTCATCILATHPRGPADAVASSMIAHYNGA